MKPKQITNNNLFYHRKRIEPKTHSSEKITQPIYGVNKFPIDKFLSALNS